MSEAGPFRTDRLKCDARGLSRVVPVPIWVHMSKIMRSADHRLLAAETKMTGLRYVTRALLLAGWVLAASVAQAQAPAPVVPAPPAPVPAADPAAISAEPQNTSATYGDWVMRCQRIGEPGKQQRVCEAAQSIQVQGQQAPIAQIALGRLAARDPLRITFVVPSNIVLPSSLKASIDDKDTQGIEAAWRRCTPGGCFADAEIKDELVKRWRAQTTQGRLQFKDAQGRDVALPFSFRGLAQALDALAKSGT